MNAAFGHSMWMDAAFSRVAGVALGWQGGRHAACGPDRGDRLRQVARWPALLAGHGAVPHRRGRRRPRGGRAGYAGLRPRRRGRSARRSSPLTAPSTGRRWQPVVFADPEQLAALNAIVHPLVGRAGRAELVGAGARRTRSSSYDVPLLVENALAGRRTTWWSSSTRPRTSASQRLVGPRAVAGRGRAGTGWRPRRPARTAWPAADYVIDNAGSLDDLASRVDQLWR